MIFAFREVVNSRVFPLKGTSAQNCGDEKCSVETCGCASEVVGMSRQSLAERICERVEGSDPRPEMLKLVIYDFNGKRIPRKFYSNLRRLRELTDDGLTVQYSAVLTRRMKTARAVRELAWKCGCQNVQVYVVEMRE